MQLTNGTLLHGGTYKIEKVLGQGSFGITYLAEHVHLGRKVAIKEFFMKELNSRSEDGSITGMSDGSLSYNYAQKFKKEAYNLSRLDHPNIVRVTDSFEDNGTFYYVMDFIDGMNLNDYIKSNSPSEQTAVGIIKEVANALEYMHEEKQMLHLDLKPGNVMRRKSDGHVFLIDFGLSKHYDANGAPETSTTIGLGTAGYAPVEQANQAKNGDFRPTIDVYSLGATLYKLLTHDTPPAASELVSDDELLSEKMKEKGISQPLIDLVVKAMLPNVRKRIQTIREFKELLPFGEKTIEISTEEKEETIIVDGNNEQTIIAEQAKNSKDNIPSKNNQKKSLHAGIIVACISLLLIIGGFIIFSSKNSTEESAVDMITNSFDQSVIRGDIMVELDSVNMEMFTMPSIDHITNKLSSLKGKNYPQALISLKSIANEITKEDKKYLYMGMLYVDKSVCNSFDISTDIYDNIFPIEADTMWVSEYYYIKCKEDGIINHYWEMYAGAIIETLYIYMKNPSFLETLNDQEASDLTYRLALVNIALEDLAYYDNNVKNISETIKPLLEINAIALEQLREQLPKLAPQIESARMNLLKK